MKANKKSGKTFIIYFPANEWDVNSTFNHTLADIWWGFPFDGGIFVSLFLSLPPLFPFLLLPVVAVLLLLSFFLLLFSRFHCSRSMDPIKRFYHILLNAPPRYLAFEAKQKHILLRSGCVALPQPAVSNHLFLLMPYATGHRHPCSPRISCTAHMLQLEPQLELKREREKDRKIMMRGIKWEDTCLT